MSVVKAVGLRQLKNHLSRYVRDVRAGETILVTDRGQVVAELRPPGVPGEADDLPAPLLESARRGHVQLARRRGPHTYALLSRIAPDGTALDLLDADRAER